MIHVHIEASSVADLKSELKALLGGQFGTGTTCDMALNAPKIETPKTDGESDEEPKTDEPVKDEPTMEEARAALNEYRKKKGLPALKELFAAHGVTNFLDLPATEYAAIMKEAKAGAAE